MDHPPLASLELDHIPSLTAWPAEPHVVSQPPTVPVLRRHDRDLRAAKQRFEALRTDNVFDPHALLVSLFIYRYHCSYLVCALVFSI
ncbi:MAG: hypothetical protein KAY65_12870 [Planctomycetes bacterium]|nr:hypothetical protein [Planctomycetota bacterium]